MELELKPLVWWMNNLGVMSRDIWLWISNETDKLVPETECFILHEDLNLSREEQDQQEIDLKSNGLMCFFFKDQLESIQLNLKAQKSNYDLSELFEALNYYWENDAFINIKGV